MYGDKCRDYNDLGGERLKLLLSSNALHHGGSGRVSEPLHVHIWMCARKTERERVGVSSTVLLCVCVCRRVYVCALQPQRFAMMLSVHVLQ